MRIDESTKDFETWLGKFIPIVKDDLEFKHQQMAVGAFPFFRATFYRWMQRFDELPKEVTGAPTVLAVGDLHIENFGTWVDAEGRLVWGVNDFDEAFDLPYTNDLIRLASSIQLARAEGHMKIDRNEACDALLKGYTSVLAKGGSPFVLTDQHEWLHAWAINAERDPTVFWTKLTSQPKAQTKDAGEAVACLASAMPVPDNDLDLRSRRAGLGALGHPRYVALADWQGGKVAREAKQLAPSAVIWARGMDSKQFFFEEIIRHAVRCPDPFLKYSGAWQIRRLAPYCSRIELTSFPEKRDEAKIIEAMGQETANIHLGTPTQVNAILADLAAKPTHWLQKSASVLADAVEEDFQLWKKKRPS